MAVRRKPRKSTESTTTTSPAIVDKPVARMCKNCKKWRMFQSGTGKCYAYAPRPVGQIVQNDRLPCICAFPSTMENDMCFDPYSGFEPAE